MEKSEKKYQTCVDLILWILSKTAKSAKFYPRKGRFTVRVALRQKFQANRVYICARMEIVFSKNDDFYKETNIGFKYSQSILQAFQDFKFYFLSFSFLFALSRFYYY